MLWSIGTIEAEFLDKEKYGSNNTESPLFTDIACSASFISPLPPFQLFLSLCHITVREFGRMYRQFVVGCIDEDSAAGGDGALQDSFGEWVFQEGLNGAAQGASTVEGGVAAPDEQVARGFTDLESDRLFGEAALRLRDHQVDYLAQVLLLQGVEDDDFVDAVEQFGFEKVF